MSEAEKDMCADAARTIHLGYQTDGSSENIDDSDLESTDEEGQAFGEVGT